MDLETDIMIIGSGISGILLALELAAKRPDIQIIILNQTTAPECSSYLSQGGIAFSFSDDPHGIAQHTEDTLSAGAYANDREVVQKIIEQSHQVIKTLEKWGVEFDKTPSGDYHLALEGGHSAPRILHHRDFTGRYIMKALYAQVSHFPNIKFKPKSLLLDLITENGSVFGGLFWDYGKRRSFTVKARESVLATGGLGGLFHYSTNPDGTTGIALALAKKVGAKPKDCHYIQYHPTALYGKQKGRMSLISEAVRGAGAVLRNDCGTAFMAERHPLKDLAPRDFVSRCAVEEIAHQEKPYLYLDCRSFENGKFAQEFPDIHKSSTEIGIDPEKEMIPVIPVAHYTCGGVATDIFGDCGVAGLKIIGEAACTGFHGANRLASNSLLEAALMAIGLGERLAGLTGNNRLPKFKEKEVCFSGFDGIHYMALKSRIKELMHRHFSVVKSTMGLEKATDELMVMAEFVEEEFKTCSVARYRADALLDATRAIIGHAAEATENKGVFYNEDLEEVKIESVN